MSTIVISEFMDSVAVSRLESSCDVLSDPTLVDSPDLLKKKLVSARGLIVRNRTRVDESLLSTAKKIEVVGRLGVGLDNIDTEYCASRNIEVIPATGANSHSVVEYVITSALMLMRGSFVFDITTRMLSGDWCREDAVGHELAGKTLGLVGLGGIARQVAAYGVGLGMDVVAYDPNVLADDSAWQVARNVSLDGVAELSDVVSIHVPLTPTTRHLIGSDFLGAMKPASVLVNTSRGGVLDESSLVDALKKQKLRGAALDVFEEEPLTPNTSKKFEGLSNLILTPHIAGVTVESNSRVSHYIAERVLSHLGLSNDNN